MGYCFIITSAINTKFGVFDNSLRLHQTLETVASIKHHAADAVILIIEMSALPLTAFQKNILSQNCEILIEYSESNFVKEIYKNDNWDIVKNLTEVACFSDSLKAIRGNSFFESFERIFKISGRYILNSDFDLKTHLESNKIIFSKSRASSFDINLTGVPRQYMSRLWSWPSKDSNLIIENYDIGLDYMRNRLVNGGYCDIEHMLYATLNKFVPTELEFIGVQGYLGHTGIPVKD